VDPSQPLLALAASQTMPLGDLSQMPVSGVRPATTALEGPVALVVPSSLVASGDSRTTLLAGSRMVVSEDSLTTTVLEDHSSKMALGARRMVALEVSKTTRLEVLVGHLSSKVALVEHLSMEDPSPAASQDSNKVASQDSSKVVSQDSNKVASQDNSKAASQDSNKVASQDNNRVVSQDSSKVASQDSNKVASQDNSKVASQDSSRVASQDSSKVALVVRLNREEEDSLETSHRGEALAPLLQLRRPHSSRRSLIPLLTLEISPRVRADH